ncbi:MAG: transglycosylase SLT domain-containing protein [Gallionella sp.]|nr:transglycosylase SLT domain-containing protein [Gallionella sp.]MDD4945862.1 transglycosylase SLT domain-containing protein [Gallionella sp.]MDD5612503.1 transglycosylase SLT domain-containing protein [Gallionella sp.]
MSLIRLILPMLVAIGAIMPLAHAEAQLTLAPAPQLAPAPHLNLALATPTASFQAAPDTLTTGRNIKLALIQSDDPKNGDLLQHIRNGFAMNDLDSPLIATYEQWYADRPEYVARMMERASLYLYYISNEVERRGMPSEIALLPMIESAYNPIAYSPANAAGIWQFIPSTGKNFGLEQNWWYDGRRDIVSATTGALDYLQKLHDMFGDWELALAAYNWGEGSVTRAQERNRRRGLPTDYSSLKMPAETRGYVPKLLAIKNIIADPASFGLTLSPIANEPYFASVSTAKHMDVKLAAKLADISRDEFLALNPAHNRPVILQENSDYILLPMDKVETFLNNLEIYDKPLVTWQAYQAKKGEKLANLAPRFGLSLERLQKVNGISSHTHIRTGDTLLVPLGSEADDEDAQFKAFNLDLHPFQANAPASRHYARKAKLAKRGKSSLGKAKVKLAKHGKTSSHKVAQRNSGKQSYARKSNVKVKLAYQGK